MTLLYQEIAEHLDQAIAQGVYRPGERLPSVRQLGEQHRVSPATAVQALRLLEDSGRIAARPRSGYYVTERREPVLPEPATSAPLLQPTPVSGQALVLQLTKAAAERRSVPLGAAVPAASFLPTLKIERALAGCARRHRQRIAGYEFALGNPELRRQIARRMSEAGCTLSADDIVVTNGCQEAIALALRAVTEPGDIVAIESPIFYGQLQVIESLGLKAIEIPTHPRDGLSLAALQLACEQWPVKACLVVPNFSNPLGYLMSETGKRELLALARRHDFALIEDDVYGDLGFAASRPPVVKAWDEEGRVLHCSSFSKSLSPGLRIGWIAPGRYLERIEYLKYVANLASPSLSQIATAEILADGGFERHLRQIRRRYAEAVDRMTDAVARHFPHGTKSTQPAGGFVLWLELPEGSDALALAQRASLEGISIAPGPIFSASGKYRNFIRLNCACDWDRNVERALEKLGRLAAAG